MNEYCTPSVKKIGPKNRGLIMCLQAMTISSLNKEQFQLNPLTC